jgi:hypothetical protein
MNQSIVSTWEYLRLTADLAFILVGVVPMLIAVVMTYSHARREPREAAGTK